ncbi:hypothetical protein SLE2022_310680 [Rubroshorea leprosula]
MDLGIYDSISDDYKVVMFSLCGDREDVSYAETRIYSLRNNAWSEAVQRVGQRKVSPNLLSSLRETMPLSNGLFACGALHWLAWDKSVAAYILTFDLVAKEFGEILLPDYLQSYMREELYFLIDKNVRTLHPAGSF